MVQKIQYVCIYVIQWVYASNSYARQQGDTNRTSTLTTNFQLLSSASSGSSESWDRRLTVHHRDEFHSGNICILIINQYA